MTDIQAQLADGTILSFPDGTPDEVINRVVKQQTLASKASALKPTLDAQAAKFPTNDKTGVDTIGGSLIPEFLGRLGPMLDPRNIPSGIASMFTSERGVLSDPEKFKQAQGINWSDPKAGMNQLLDVSGTPDAKLVKDRNWGGVAGAMMAVPAATAIGSGVSQGVNAALESPFAGKVGNALLENRQTMRDFAENRPPIKEPLSVGQMPAAAARAVAGPAANLIAKAEGALYKRLGPPVVRGSELGNLPQVPPEQPVSRPTRAIEPEPYNPELFRDRTPAPEAPFRDPILDLEQPSTASVRRPSPASADVGGPANAMEGAAERVPPAPRLTPAELLKTQLGRLQQGIAASPTDKGAVASSIRNAPRLMKVAPELIDAAPGPEFDAALVDAFRAHEMAVDAAEKAVPRSAVVEKGPILAKWRQIVQEANASPYTRGAAAALQNSIKAWNKLPNEIPWEQFTELKRAFLKDTKTPTFRKAYQELMDNANAISNDLELANADYSVVRRALDDAKIIVARDEAGNIINAQRVRPMKKK